MKVDFYSEVNHQFLFSLYDSKKLQKDSRVRNHHHTDFEISMILDGTATYLLGETPFPIQEKDIVLVRTNELHCFPQIASQSLTAFNIRMSPYYLLQICTDYIEQEKIRAFINSEMPIKNLFHGNEALLYRMQNLYNLVHANADENRFQIRMRMLEFINLLSNEVRVQNSQPPLPNSALQNIQAVIDYIKENYAKQISLADIARATAMSQSYICSNFKRIVGVSPYDYIITERLERAVELIKNSNLTILQISMKCGFNTITSFNKAFKKKMNVTPNSLRS